MPTEADTCRKYVLPKLSAAGWIDDQICEQRRIVGYLDGLVGQVAALLPSILDKEFKGEL